MTNNNNKRILYLIVFMCYIILSLCEITGITSIYATYLAEYLQFKSMDSIKIVDSVKELDSLLNSVKEKELNTKKELDSLINSISENSSILAEHKKILIQMVNMTKENSAMTKENLEMFKQFKSIIFQVENSTKSIAIFVDNIKKITFNMSEQRDYIDGNYTELKGWAMELLEKEKGLKKAEELFKSKLKAADLKKLNELIKCYDDGKVKDPSLREPELIKWPENVNTNEILETYTQEELEKKIAEDINKKMKKTKTWSFW